jgi:hypothetical protein
MKMTLSEYLDEKYEHAVRYSRCVLSDDGLHILKWDTALGVQPTTAQIEADMPAQEALKSKREKMRELANTDAGMFRVTEDIWDVLKAKNLVTDADLPLGTVAKLANRKSLREAIR